MSVTSFTRKDLQEELFDLAQDQAVASEEQWGDLVNTIVEEHIDLGHLDKDQDTQGVKEYLRTLWSAYKEQMTDPAALIEDHNEEQA